MSFKGLNCFECPSHLRKRCTSLRSVCLTSDPWEQIQSMKKSQPKPQSEHAAMVQLVGDKSTNQRHGREFRQNLEA
jgi:hypothetical protein